MYNVLLFVQFMYLAFLLYSPTSKLPLHLPSSTNTLFSNHSDTPVTQHILVHLIEQASRSIPMYHRIVRNLFGALWRGSSVINDQTLCKEFVILHIDIVF